MKIKTVTILLAASMIICSLTGCVFFEAKEVALKSDVTVAEAQQIAATHFGLDVSECVFEKTELENGRYEIEFVHNGRDYDVKIIASTGTVISIEVEEGFKQGADGETGKVVDQSDVLNNTMTEEEAKRIAFAHLGVNAEECTVTSITFEDGSYEIEFFCNGVEYDVEVHAKSGRVTEIDADGN